MSSELRVGLIGLGAMGWPMAVNLVKAGANLTSTTSTPTAKGSLQPTTHVSSQSTRGTLPVSRS